MLSTQKLKAIKLRKEGKSYSEILETVSVAKSTLSLWLRSVDLSKTQKQRLTAKKFEAAKRGGAVRKEACKKLTNEIYKKAEKQIGRLSNRELFLVGVALYWAEGTKEKEEKPGSGVQLTNSDPRMLRTFLLWLRDISKVDDKKIHFQIYLHETSDHRVKEVIEYWSKNLGVATSRLDKIYFKRNRLSTNRNNIGESYYGLLRIKVRGSSSLVRLIAGWVNGITSSF